MKVTSDYIFMQTKAPSGRLQKNANADDAVPAALVDKKALSLTFFDNTIFIKALRKLEKEMALSYFVETERIAPRPPRKKSPGGEPGPSREREK